MARDCAVCAVVLLQEPAGIAPVQALTALLWIAYGLLIHAAPVVVANLVVAALAIYSSLRVACRFLPGSVDEAGALRKLAAVPADAGPRRDHTNQPSIISLQ